MHFQKITCIVLLTINVTFAQDRPLSFSKTNGSFYKYLIAPTVLVSAGLAIKINDHGLNYRVRDARNNSLPDFHTQADDYLQYAPVATVFGLQAAGIRSQNNFGNSLALIIKSELLMTAFVQPLKRSTNVTRPDGSADNSFPSGHTAQAFVAATFLHKEFGQQSIWYSIGAYTCATAVGTLRILNNRHWLSDVLVGAGIGIFSTNIVYYTHRYRWNGKSPKAMVMPTYANGPGLYVSYRFR